MKDPRWGTGTGSWGTFSSPRHPMGISFRTPTSPQGVKSPCLHPLIDEFPVGDRGSGIGDRGPIAIPSLEVHVRGAGFKIAGAATITPSAWIQSVS
jgi:hypothetical protein